jgi:hypothetical protein
MQQLRGSDDPLGGWHSPSFGTNLPATQLLLHGTLGTGEALRVDVTLHSENPHEQAATVKNAPGGQP